MRWVEYILAVLGAGICIGGALLFSNPFVPFALTPPGRTLRPSLQFYLFELALLGFVGLVSVLANTSIDKFPWRAVTWFVVGAVTAFMWLGADSGGLLLLWAIAAFLIAALLADYREHYSIGGHLGLSAVAAILQAIIIQIAQVPLPPI